jgi:hypothetical protein
MRYFTARPKNKSSMGLEAMTSDIYPTGYSNAQMVDKPKPKYLAYCNSRKCFTHFKVNRSKYSERDLVNNYVPKTNVKFTDTFCPDCSAALFWKKEEDIKGKE